MAFPRISTFKTAEQFRATCELSLNLLSTKPSNWARSRPLNQPLKSVCGEIGNRWCILPMEGWDGTTDGRQTELTRRRWKNFGLSGAKLMWVVKLLPFDGRSSHPNQLMINEQTLPDLIVFGTSRVGSS